MEEKSVVKASASFFNAVAPDMKLEQGNQRFKKDVGGIIGQTKQNVFVTEQELAYHEILDFRKSCNNITRSVLAETVATTLNKGLQSKNMKEYYEAVKQVFDFLNEGGNPYKMVGPVKLPHVFQKQVLPSNKSDFILSFLENGSKNYLKFCEERFLNKEKISADTIR